jgi:hypothetical protein
MRKAQDDDLVMSLVVIAGLAGAIAYRAAPAERETIRLAILPFETDAGSKRLSGGLLQDTAESPQHRERIRLADSQVA